MVHSIAMKTPNPAAQELGRLSWEARKKKHGEEGARDILRKAAQKGGRPRTKVDKPIV